MNPRFNLTQRVVQTGLAVLAAALLVTGAAWHGLAADGQTTHAAMATVTTPITHAVAGGREHADLVDEVHRSETAAGDSGGRRFDARRARGG